MPEDQRSPNPQFSVRWEQHHQQTLTRLAREFGMNRQHFAALVLSTALGLPRPEGVPAVPIDLASLPVLVQQVMHGHDQEEVLAHSA